MRKLGHSRMVVAVILCCGVPAAAWAQSGRRVQQPPPKPGEPAPGEKPVVRVETREVLLPLSAWDLEGRVVADLRPQDLLVVEEGQPRTITDLRREPANIVLVLDLSNEIGTFKNGPSEWARRDERRLGIDPEAPLWGGPSKPILPNPAPRELAKNLVAALAPGDEIAIIQYADRVQLVQDWTADREEAQEALRSKFRVGIKARYYDALALAAQKLGERAAGRRVVVLVSDGLDSASRARRQQALAALAKTRAAVFVIGWAELVRGEIENAIGWIGAHEPHGTATTKRVNELRRHLPQLDGGSEDLRQLAEASGGEMWLPESFEEFVVLPRRILGEVGAQYTLAFSTERGPSLEALRSVEVIPARKGLSVRARRSYYLEGEAPQ